MNEQRDKEAWRALELSLKQVTPEDREAQAHGQALLARALEMTKDDWVNFMQEYLLCPARYRLFFFTGATLEGKRATRPLRRAARWRRCTTG